MAIPSDIAEKVARLRARWLYNEATDIARVRQWSLEVIDAYQASINTSRAVMEEGRQRYIDRLEADYAECSRKLTHTKGALAISITVGAIGWALSLMRLIVG